MLLSEEILLLNLIQPLSSLILILSFVLFLLYMFIFFLRRLSGGLWYGTDSISTSCKNSPEASTLSVIYIKESTRSEKREFGWKQIKVDQLSPTAAKQVCDKLNLYYEKIEVLTVQSKGCRKELLCYGAFFDTLNDELEDAISKTDSNYEEELLLKNLEHPCNLLEEIINKLKKIKAEEDLTVQFRLEAENELEKEFSNGEHLYDFGATKELANMLHEDVGPDYTIYEEDSTKNDASADNCKEKEEKG